MSATEAKPATTSSKPPAGAGGSGRPRRRSITKTHERISQLGWEPSYHAPVAKYPTRYHIPAKAKDPMKQIMREYLPMELEKDERVYGGHDAAVRSGMAGKVSRRWLEILKPFIQVTNFAEVGAGRCMSLLIDAIDNKQVRNGYHLQFLDELRHTGMQMGLARWYAKNTAYPYGWNIGAQGLARDPVTGPGVNMLSHFMVGDPIQCAFTLQVVAETALTNVVFVALPEVGQRNGDFALPTTYLSVQSDEARHISNGYATLLTVLQDDRNADLIVHDLQQAWWLNHSFIDPFGGAVLEYFSKDRSDPECYLDKWDRWVRDDWYRAYILKLGKLGLDIPPDMFDHARQRHVNGLVARFALFGYASWPLHFWRFDQWDGRDYEFFENHYPGWYDEFGDFFEAHSALVDPREGALLMGSLLAEAPPMCWTCQLPCVIEEDRVHRCVDAAGNIVEPTAPGARTRFYCSWECRWIDETNPGRYVGDRQWFDRYDGWELSEVVRDLGFVQPDGKTLIAQPHCSEDIPLWTLADIRRCEVELASPNRVAAEAMGLPFVSTADGRRSNARVADEVLAQAGFTGAPSPGGLRGETVLNAPDRR
jgi:propane monooxygenase large subunit